MTLGTRHRIQLVRQLNISISNTQLNPVSSQKLLGVHIDETLSWNQHINYLCAAAVLGKFIILLLSLECLAFQ